MSNNAPIVLALAAIGHRMWCEMMVAQGWRRGPKYDAARREHDALVPFEALSEHDKRLVCLAIAADKIPQRLEKAVEFPRGPDREFSLDELRVGLSVTWADWIPKPEGRRMEIVERGQIVSWDTDPSTAAPSMIRVRWESGEVSEHHPSERDLQRLDELEGGATSP